jgi:hypothetical protein
MNTILCLELTHPLLFVIDVHEYIPARPAPHAQSHDDPAFSDSGDDEYCEFTACFASPDGEKVAIPDSMSWLYDLLMPMVYEECRELYGSRKNKHEEI